MPTARVKHTSTMLALALIGVSLVWAYWTTLAVMVAKWTSDPQYSHGFLIPIIAAGLAWKLWHGQRVAEQCGTRANTVANSEIQLSAAGSWWGIVIIAGGLGMRLFAAYYYFEWFDALSLLPCIAGAIVLVIGWSGLQRLWPVVVFLGFMLPLPYRLEITAAAPLQRIATAGGTFLLQTCGLPAVADGNTIILDHVSLGIAEACSGLRMLMVFFAVSTFAAIVVDRPLWERAMLLASAVPIALFCNVIRITLTGILHQTVGSALADLVFHDLAGWLMMPMAMGCLCIEMQILSRILIEQPDREVIPVMPTRSFGGPPAETVAAPGRRRLLSDHEDLLPRTTSELV